MSILSCKKKRNILKCPLLKISPSILRAVLGTNPQSSTWYYPTEQYFELSHSAVLCTIPQTQIALLCYVHAVTGKI